MFRYRLRTLMIVLALGPSVLGYIYDEYERRKRDAEQRELDRLCFQVLYGGKTRAVGRYGLSVEMLPSNRP